MPSFDDVYSAEQDLQSGWHGDIKPLYPGSGDAAYEGGGEWLDQLIGYLAGNLALVRDFCKNRVPQIQLVEPEGTYLAWLDCRELGMTDDELMAFFSDEAKVWLDPGTHSGEQGSGFMRFNLGSSRSVIAQALDQIEAAWKKRNA